jgi:NAD dependent epimerase/dehydratase family enzyme
VGVVSQTRHYAGPEGTRIDRGRQRSLDGASANRERRCRRGNRAPPHPLPNRDFLHILRQAWGTRIGLPTTTWMIEVGTFLLRTESELVLKSRQVVPGRLVNSGFEFSYPTWPEAANELVARWRRTRC